MGIRLEELGLVTTCDSVMQAIEAYRSGASLSLQGWEAPNHQFQNCGKFARDL